MFVRDAERDTLLRKIQELEFVALELNLYLNTHPDEKDPLEHFNRVSKELRQAINKYEECYGPLFNFGLSPIYGDKWTWKDDPWPWDI